MEEEKTVFSEITEKIYKTETESAVNVPNGFKDSVMKKIKVEKMKSRKKAIIAVSSVAAALILVVGIVTLSMNSDILTKDYSSELSAPMETEGSADGSANVEGNEVDETEKPQEDGRQHSDYFEMDNGYYDWNSFYEAVENGEIDPSGEEAKKYVEDNRHFFDVSGMDIELEQSKELINRVDPYDGFPSEERQETDLDSYADFSQMVKVFLALNFYDDPKTGEELNWFEFYNACLEARIDPRFGLAYEYLNYCHDFFVEKNNSKLIYQSELLLSTKGDLNK